MFDCKALVGMLLAGLLFCPGTVLAGQDVHSQKVAVAPVVDGNPADPAWMQVKPLSIVDTASGARILLRSVYTDDQVYFLVQFPDAVQNFLHKPWVWNAAKEQYESGEHREDTFVFKWSMMNRDVNLSNFSDDDYRADVWYWKANRTNPAGYADDKMQILSAEPIEKSSELTSLTGKARYLGRYSDTGKGPYKEIKEITAHQGDLVDRYPTSQPEGSRADVKAKGHWNGGFWVVEFSRKLDTGHEDDVRFDPASGKPYLFGVSIFSLYGRPHDPNSPNFYGRGRISEPLALRFQ